MLREMVMNSPKLRTTKKRQQSSSPALLPPVSIIFLEYFFPVAPHKLSWSFLIIILIYLSIFFVDPTIVKKAIFSLWSIPNLLLALLHLPLLLQFIDYYYLVILNQKKWKKPSRKKKQSKQRHTQDKWECLLPPASHPNKSASRRQTESIQTDSLFILGSFVSLYIFFLDWKQQPLVPPELNLALPLSRSLSFNSPAIASEYERVT